MTIENEILEKLEKSRQIQVLSQERDMLIQRLQNYQQEAEARFKYIQNEIKLKETMIQMMVTELQKKTEEKKDESQDIPS